MPHFHIPLQSGSDKILKYMKRKYLATDYTLVIDKVKNKIPNACIGVDVIRIQESQMKILLKHMNS